MNIFFKCILTILMIAIIGHNALSDDSISQKKATPTVNISGAIQSVSTIPEAAKSDYPDCYYTVLVKLGEAPTAREVILFVKCFENKKDLLCNRFSKGDLISADCVAYDDAPESERQIQQSDQIERYDLNFFFANKICKVQAIAEQKNADAGKKKAEVFIPPPPLCDQIKQEIAAYIRSELQSVTMRLKSGDPQRPIPIHYSTQAQEHLELFKKTKDPAHLVYWEKGRVVRINPSFSILAQGECNQRAVDIITQFDQELKKRNIRFIFVSFPLWWEPILPLTSTNISPQISFDATRLKTVQALLQNDVEMIELGHYLYEKQCDFSCFFDILANDDHPMDRIIDLLADLLKERLNSYDFSQYAYPASCFSSFQQEFLRKNRYPEGNPAFQGIPTISGYKFTASGKIKKSPVFVIGDSFSATPYQTGGIRSFLGAKTGLVIDGYQNHSGSTRMMRILSGRNYLPLSQKQVVIMLATSQCFSPNYAYWESLKTDWHTDVAVTADNYPRSWGEKAHSADGFLYLDTKQNGSFFQTELLECDLPGFADSQICNISIQLSTSLTQVNVLSSSKKRIAFSGFTDPSDKPDNIALSAPYESLFGNKIFLQFLTKRKQNIKVKDIFFAFSPNPNSPFLHGPGKVDIGFKDYKSIDKQKITETQVSFSGQNIFVDGGKYLAIRDDSKISAQAKIRNIGDTSVEVSFGLAMYDPNGNPVSTQNYAFKNNRQQFSVLSISADRKAIILDALPQELGNKCVLAKIGKNPYSCASDILGTIADVQKQADGSAVVTLTAPLKQALASGEKVRINNPWGGYLYLYRKRISPKGQEHISFDIARKGNWFQFSREALPDGASYAKPVIFVRSLSSGKPAAIEISNFKIAF